MEDPTERVDVAPSADADCLEFAFEDEANAIDFAYRERSYEGYDGFAGVTDALEMGG